MNVSEDEVLAALMRRLLATDSWDIYVDIQTGTLRGSLIIDGVVDISLDEAAVLRQVKG